MSYDIQLVDPVTRETLRAPDPHFIRGGTYCVGRESEDGEFEPGDTRLSLNITWNYSEHFYRVFPGGKDSKGVRTIYGLTGAESLPVLEAAIAQLGDDVDENYWTSTEGNAKRALCGLRALAQMRPDGVWDGD